MKNFDVKKAQLIAKQFVTRCEKVIAEEARRYPAGGREQCSVIPGKHSGALRRCSMELTRQLAIMRRSNGDSRPHREPAFVSECRLLLNSGDKIKAIKVWRRETGAGLKDAKEAVEALR